MNASARRSATYVAALVLFVIGCRGTKPATARGLSPCTIGSLHASCRTVEVFENREKRAGRKIALKVVVVPSHAAHPQPDPLFLIAGGPGQGVTGGAEDWAKIFDFVLRQRELVLIDVRGTGESNPLNCPLAPKGTLQERFEPLAETAKSCLPLLREKADLTQYQTEYIADDLDDARESLGYERINVQAASYGTRVAQVYARRHGEHVRSMILEGVYPLSEHIPLGVSRNSQQVLDAILQLCADDTKCQRHYPDLRQELAQVEKRLQQGPVKVTLPNPGSKRDETVELDHGMAAQAIRFMLYGVYTANQVPKLIHITASGDWKPLAERALRNTINSPGYSFGMWLSVTCTEDVQYIREEHIAPDSAGTFFGDFRVRGQRAACALWPKGKTSAQFSTPVRSDVPALLMEGALDPMTPPRYARAVAATMPNARVVELPGYGHVLNGMIGDDCIDRIEGQFLKQGSAAALDTSCMAKLRRPEFD